MNKKLTLTDDMTQVIRAYSKFNQLPAHLDGLKSLIRLVSWHEHALDKPTALFFAGRYSSYGITTQMLTHKIEGKVWYYIWIPVLQNPVVKLKYAHGKIKILQ